MRSLFKAGEEKNLNVLQRLLQNQEKLKIYINQPNDEKNKQTLLHIAAYEACPEIITFLISKGADVNAKDNLGNTPFHCAASNLWENSNKDIVKIMKLLKDNKANIDIQNLDGNTPLHCSLETKNLEKFTTLIEMGANPDIKNLKGETAKDIAISKYGEKIINSIINNFKNKNLVCDDLLGEFRSRTELNISQGFEFHGKEIEHNEEEIGKSNFIMITDFNHINKSKEEVTVCNNIEEIDEIAKLNETFQSLTISNNDSNSKRKRNLSIDKATKNFQEAYKRKKSIKEIGMTP